MKEMSIKEIMENKEELIHLKKSALKFTDDGINKIMPHNVTSKAYYENNEEAGVLKRTIIGNTYLWMDSHHDVLLPGCFAKSLKERGQKAPHLHDHKFELSARVGKPQKIYEQEMAWNDLGVNFMGKTECLLMDTEIRRELNKDVFRDYLNDEIDQHSVGMRYIKIAVGVNDEDYPSEYEFWNKWIDKIANKEKVESKGFFWGIVEGALIEVSAVLMGANELTFTMSSADAGKSEPISEPSVDTHLLEGIKSLQEKFQF